MSEVQTQQTNQGAQELYKLLRARTVKSLTTARTQIMQEPIGELSEEEKSALLDLIGTENVPAELADITYVKGRKDTFYYDGTIMTKHYAELDVMIQEKDLLYTIATVTRSDCFLYPRPCQFSKLMDVPFRMKMEELLSAEARMAQEPDYQDIHVVTASNGKKGFYSTLHMSENYAQALIEWIEVGEDENP